MGFTKGKKSAYCATDDDILAMTRLQEKSSCRPMMKMIKKNATTFARRAGRPYRRGMKAKKGGRAWRKKARRASRNKRNKAARMRNKRKGKKGRKGRKGKKARKGRRGKKNRWGGSRKMPRQSAGR